MIVIMNTSNKGIIIRMKTIGLLVWKGLLLFQKAFLIIGGVFASLLVLVEVILRYVVGSPLFGIEELIVFVAVWLFFMGASYGTYERSHVKADVLNIWIKDPIKLSWIEVMVNFITIILAVVFALWNFSYIEWSLVKAGKTVALRIPRYIPQFSILLGSLLMILYFFAELIDNLKRLRRSKSNQAASNNGNDC